MPDITKYSIKIYGHDDFKYIPYNDLSNTIPQWWYAYNKIKHYRIDNQEYANMENLIYSLSALFILDMSYLKCSSTEGMKDIPNKESNLFICNDINWNYRNASGLCMQIQSIEES